MHYITARLQVLDFRVSSALMRADSFDENEIVLEIATSSAQSILSLCWICLVLTDKKTQFHSPFAAEETVC